MVFLLCALSLSSCVAVQQTADQIAREQARNVVNAEVARRFPGVNAAPVTDCVIDNASAQEIVTIAGGAALGNDQAAVETVSEIMARPTTLDCMTGGVLGGIL